MLTRETAGQWLENWSRDVTRAGLPDVDKLGLLARELSTVAACIAQRVRDGNGNLTLVGEVTITDAGGKKVA